MTTKVQSQHSQKQVVVFKIASECYGVDIGVVREIIRLQEVAKVPRAPEFVAGVINLRGRIIPVVDLGVRLTGAPCKDNTDARIIVADIDGQDTGIAVDEVTEVLRLPEQAVEPPSSIIANADTRYLTGIANLKDRLIILIDLNRVFTRNEMLMMERESQNLHENAHQAQPA